MSRDVERIPIIDLFAGPGGLGEGFSALRDRSRNPFRIGLSVEKDKAAHSTLLLRAFFRQFNDGAPDEYYGHLRGEITRDELMSQFKTEADTAKRESWLATLGEVCMDELDRRVRTAVGKARAWVLIGGPPCQAYSLVGRSRRGGISADDHRVFLYREYLRILAVHAPPVFVMENVTGLLSSKLDGEHIFPLIHADLQSPVKALAHDARMSAPRRTKEVNYRIFSLVRDPRSFDLFGRPEFAPRDFVIRSEDYGIPQKRHRVILVGVREDLIDEKPTPLTLQDPVSVEAVLKRLPTVRSGLSKSMDSPDEWVRQVGSFLGSNLVRSSIGIGNGLRAVAAKMIDTVQRLRHPRADRGDEFIRGKFEVDYRNDDWFHDARLGGICNHSTRGHIASDLHRYLFAACFAQLEKRSPGLADFPTSLLPNHRNVKKAIDRGHFADRFRVQVADQPATTVTSHISKDGHYYIHYDPKQCRSLTVREAARIQTFPDNYLFCGNRTEQYGQVGNAVPPMLAYQIAERVYDLLKKSNLTV